MNEKVLCVDNEFCEDKLTLGKEYEVSYYIEEREQYAIENDNGVVSCVSMKRFKTL